MPIAITPEAHEDNGNYRQISLLRERLEARKTRHHALVRLLVDRHPVVLAAVVASLFCLIAVAKDAGPPAAAAVAAAVFLMVWLRGRRVQEEPSRAEYAAMAVAGATWGAVGSVKAEAPLAAAIATAAIMAMLLAGQLWVERPRSAGRTWKALLLRR